MHPSPTSGERHNGKKQYHVASNDHRILLEQATETNAAACDNTDDEKPPVQHWNFEHIDPKPRVDMEDLASTTLQDPTTDTLPLADDVSQQQYTAARAKTSQEESSNLLRKLLTNSDKLPLLQDRFLTNQTRLKHARETAVINLDSLKESISRFADYCKTSTGGAYHQFQTFEHVDNLQNDVINDIELVQQELQSIARSEQSLGRLEYRLAKKQALSIKQLREYLESEGHYFENSAPPSIPSSRQQSPPPSDPLLEGYTKLRGEVRLLRDKLHDIQGHLQMLHNEIGDIPSPNTLDAENQDVIEMHKSTAGNLQMDYDSLEGQLRQKEGELKTSWKACREAGLDVGSLGAELSWPSSTEHVPLPASTSIGFGGLNLPPFMPEHYVPQFLKDFRWPRREDLPGAILPEFSELGGKWDMVQRWLQVPAGVDAIFGQPLEPAHAVAWDYTVAPPKSDSEWLDVQRASESMISIKDSEPLQPDVGTPHSRGLIRSKALQRVLRESRSDEALGKRATQTWERKRASEDVLEKIVIR